MRHGDRGTWLGTTQDLALDDEEVEFRYGTVGPALYGGAAGIALFLAEMARHLASPDLGEIAAAGMHHALDGTDRLDRTLQLGFYEGAVGIAWAAARAARCLDRADLEVRAQQLLDGLPAGPPAGPIADLITGASGAIPPLLGLAGRLGRDDLRDLATRLGDAVIAAAHREETGWVWPVAAGAIEARLPLTGLAHGAAGIGWALLELGQAVKEPRFLEAGANAFRSENRWFRPEAGNWPDFRDDDLDTAGCCLAWCHGAPGIALTRLRAVALGHAEFAGDTAAALRTTRVALADRDGWVDTDCSLCHGLTGLAAILREAGPPATDRDLIDAVARVGPERYGTRFQDWPVGVRRGSNPSLMVGLAGVGYFYLGLAEPGLGSVLLPVPG